MVTLHINGRPHTMRNFRKTKVKQGRNNKDLFPFIPAITENPYRQPNLRVESKTSLKTSK